MTKFRDSDGRIVMRSTKERKRGEAQKVADKWEYAARKARAGELTQAASIKILSELMEQSIGERLEVYSTEKFLTEWLAARGTIGRSSGTLKRYEPIIKGFIGFIGPRRAAASVSSVTAAEIERFRNQELTAGKGGSTANFAVKVLRAAFNSARRKGLALSNPAEAVEALDARTEERETFTDEEIARLLKAAKEKDWRGMILFGAHCGLRLADAANLTWKMVDLDAGMLTFQPAKTSHRANARPLTIALHSDIVEFLKGRQRGIGEAPIFPSLKGRKSGSHGGLSNAFAALMKEAGVIGKLGAEKKGKGRRFRSKGFHSLRHVCVSRLANNDVPADVRKSIVGHSSDAMHRKYVHLDVSTQKRAISKLPTLLPGAKRGGHHAPRHANRQAARNVTK